MNIKFLAIILIFFLIGLCPILIFNFFMPETIIQKEIVFEKPQIESIADFDFKTKFSQQMESGAEFEVKACKVIDGYRFKMYIDGDKSLVAHLSQATKEEASRFVIEWLNQMGYPPPTIVLRRETTDFWIVDFYVTLDNKRYNLLDLLKANGLLL